MCHRRGIGGPTCQRSRFRLRRQTGAAGQELLHHAGFDVASLSKATSQRTKLVVCVNEYFSDSVLLTPRWEVDLDARKCSAIDVDNRITLSGSGFLVRNRWGVRQRRQIDWIETASA